MKKSVTGIGKQTVAIFPLSEKVVNNNKQPEEIGLASIDVM